MANVASDEALPAAHVASPHPHGMGDRLVRAASFLGGDVAARGLAFAVVLAGARVMGPGEFGRFAFVTAVASICLLVADFGLTPLTMRRLSADATRRRETLWSASAVNLALAAFVYLVSLAALAAWSRGYAALFALYGIVLFIHAIATSAEALLFATDRASRVGVNRLCGNAVLVVAAAVALVVDGSAEALLLAFVLASVAKLALGLFATRQIVRAPSFDREIARGLLRAAVPFALAAITSFLYFRVDVVLLGVLSSEESVGQYSAAYRFVDGMILVPIALAYVFFPGWVRPGARKSHALVVVKMLVLLGLVASLAFLVAGRDAARFLLGPEFAGSGETLFILALGFPVLFVDVVAVWLAYSHRREWDVIKVSLAALVVNVGLNLVLIPRYDFEGAAAATVVAEVVNFAGYAILFRALVRARLDAILAAAARLLGAAAAAGVVVLVLQLAATPSGLAALAGATTLLAVLLLSGFLLPEERRELWRRRDDVPIRAG